MRDNNGLDSVLHGMAPRAPEPSPDDVTETTSHAMVGRGREVPAIDFIWPEGRREGFCYSQLMWRHYVPGQLTLTVGDIVPRLVIIIGRNLEQLADLIRDRRCCKVRIAHSSMVGKDGELVVTDVRLEKLKEPED